MSHYFWQGDWPPGVLSREQLKELIVDHQFIQNVSDFEKDADYSAIDLSLDSKAWEMVKGSIKPCGPDPVFSQVLRNDQYARHIDPDTNGYYNLDPSKCYVFQLSEHFTPQMYGSYLFGQATAKSSIGRLDVIARLIIDGQSRYDYFDSNLSSSPATGNLYVEIIPISFGIKVRKGVRLSQLRLFYGCIDDCIITDNEFIKSIFLGGDDRNIGFLSVNLNNVNIAGIDACAYMAKNCPESNPYIDLSQDTKLSPVDYWELKPSDSEKKLIIESNNFYLIRSKENISLPSSVAVYARAMDETLGEMRIHYAGFVHPHFGQERSDGIKGTPLMFEIRGHNADVCLSNGESLAKLNFYRMSKDAIKRESNNAYKEQELKLSKYFDHWPLKMGS
ncbi:MAG TPA: 2'-deoxycytidine 5'-triphosphate deaminase [bacterium]|nr:2'-deoxycytidine 5'-triphosphate deaminase [bacterium]